MSEPNTITISSRVATFMSCHLSVLIYCPKLGCVVNLFANVCEWQILDLGLRRCSKQICLNPGDGVWIQYYLYSMV